MKSIFNKKNIVGVLACLLLVLGSMDCWAESPVDKTLDRDEEFLDQLFY